MKFRIIEDLAEVPDKDQGVVDNVYASALRDIKKSDKIKEETTKTSEADKLKEKPNNPKMAPGAKQMHLDESLFG